MTDTNTDIIVGNDNVRPARLTELVELTLDDYLLYAEKDSDEEIEESVALVELAATAIPHESPHFQPLANAIASRLF